MMRWPWSSDSSDGPKPARHWNESLNKTDWEHYKEPRNWVPTAIATTTILAAVQFYRSYLRRIPGTNYIHPGFFRRRSLFGRVTSVGDGDNFHLFHTPGGRLAGWSWLRSIPTERKALKGKTIPVRIAGVDAPEAAHFGREAQPFSAEALEFLKSYILGRDVRTYIYRRDQYERVVGTVWVRRWLLRKDVGLEMIKRGLATVYDAKIGAEFGGLEEKYRAAEAKAKLKKLGMWGAKGKFESPRDYKNRHAATSESKLS
ncbi:putative endonuclease lcl3 [Pyricularia oryzae]|uniref:Probable endonuclease LCL3 n=5 Tax=Pyricularia TaxID=48558 RepID=LCL3_PYRO7|nr:uncharacterized protein MGG_04702 [Pyricularia oryzae 70-15]A4RMK0.2 RecName: Full=Probable endonuclease LCL3 [Pyricularia oryzae 70-15]KAH8837391.1 putative endonuclease lcl3 [Pyricularia oryzae]KAI6292561.1 putative endonuclease lcl3 [Pyricularia grisea]EHA53878.1 hypothetical protein MGG_04702 [Pyricularia oryzae 70-15]KAI6253685.1 putative endonuclease lcl3 [Pyricularia oryzae]KAI6265411.1 putative endonuclease lcl3 [Pyricularia oryzae]